MSALRRLADGDTARTLRQRAAHFDALAAELTITGDIYGAHEADDIATHYTAAAARLELGLAPEGQA